MKKSTKLYLASTLVAAALVSQNANAGCSDISHAQLQNAANAVLAAGNTGGFGLNMWATFVNETGNVCAVVNTGTKGRFSGNSQWLGSRVISAQKANTGNAFSLDGVAISSGALFAAVQPGGSLYGLQESNPVDAQAAYKGNSNSFGKADDPLVGSRVGGINVFGGGLPLYKNGKKIGGIGVSGDTSCTDHAFAWRMRTALAAEPGAIAAFEVLTLGSVYDDLGKHPNCKYDSDIVDAAASGLAAIPAPPPAP